MVHAHKRILIVDDNPQIHKDFLKILTPKNPALESTIIFEELLFETNNVTTDTAPYIIDTASQGKEALDMVKKSRIENKPYSLIFMDICMPPGWNGLETIKYIWEVDPSIQMVICSAYSEHSWHDITHILGATDNLLILKKPFEVIEIRQLALALTKKWELISNLNTLIEDRTAELAHLSSLTRATLESTEEGIIAVGLDGKILIYNNKFMTQWGFIQRDLQVLNAEAVFKHMNQLAENPEIFTKTLPDFLKDPKSGHIEIELKNHEIYTLYAHPQYLKNTIIGMVYGFQNITERKRLEKQLLHQATHDILTGLPNRALLIDRIEQALGHAKRFNLQVGIILLDLDNFKGINDTFGHDAGDSVLIQAAQMLSNSVRSNDTVSRLEGDEFALVLVAQPTENNFLEFITKLIEKFSRPFSVNEREVVITVCAGISIFPQDGKDANTLIKNADSAMYQAMELGQNQFQFYMDAFNTQILQRSELKLALNNAIANNELFLLYQPLVDLETGTTMGFEALLRWKHPELGLLSPLTFIPIAEESGQIIAIGEWVLQTACAQVKQWESTLRSDIKISVNISVKQFRQQNFVSMVRKVLQETKLDPCRLEMEITESLILGKISGVIERMLELKELGVRFAIDDFGTGYSSLSYLKHFPFDTVKIDKTFMDKIDTDSNNASIVEAIIGMTRRMNIDVLAEGVENINQVNFLRKHHGSQVQGYYFSHPLEAEACLQLLRNQYADKDEGQA